MHAQSNNEVLHQINVRLLHNCCCLNIRYYDAINTHTECKDGTQEKPSMSSVVQGYMQSLDQGECLCFQTFFLLHLCPAVINYQFHLMNGREWYVHMSV